MKGWDQAELSVRCDAVAALVLDDGGQLIGNLAALGEAGALGGIRAVVAARLGQIRGGVSASLPRACADEIGVYDPEAIAATAALLAAEIDRQEGRER